MGMYISSENVGTNGIFKRHFQSLGREEKERSLNRDKVGRWETQEDTVCKNIQGHLRELVECAVLAKGLGAETGEEKLKEGEGEKKKR